MIENSFGLFFFLKQPKNQKSDERYVYLRITVDGIAKEISTKRMWNVSKWDQRTDTGYLIFMIIGIVGYFTVPSVANYIVHAASGGALPQKVSNMAGSATHTSAMMAGSGAARGGAMLLGGTAMVVDAMGDGASAMKQSMASQGNSSGYFNDKLQGNS